LCVSQKSNSDYDESVDYGLAGLPDVKCKHIPRPVDIEQCQLKMDDCDLKSDNDTHYWLVDEWSNVSFLTIIIKQ
jgi:hypothetical protein